MKWPLLLQHQWTNNDDDDADEGEEIVGGGEEADEWAEEDAMFGRGDGNANNNGVMELRQIRNGTELLFGSSSRSSPFFSINGNPNGTMMVHHHYQQRAGANHSTKTTTSIMTAAAGSMAKVVHI